MSYINREAEIVSTTVIGEATVTIAARKVGTKVIAEVTEVNSGKWVSKTRMNSAVKDAAKALLAKPGTPRTLNSSAVVTVANSLDENGHAKTESLNVGSHVFILGR